MMAAYFPNRSKSKSLTDQIREAERQVLNRQQGVGVRTATLVRRVHQRMTAPTSLLLAGGVGFIIGELTKRQTVKSRGTTDNPHTTETTPLKTALSLMTSVRTLYTALPIAWLVKTFYQPGASRQATERQCQPEAAASGAAVNGQKSKWQQL